MIEPDKDRRRGQRRAKAAAAREAARRAERRRSILLRAGLAAAGLAVLGGVTAGIAAAAQPPALPAPAAATGGGAPPWPAPTDPTEGIRAAGLDFSRMTGDHFHSHLNIRIDGDPVPVPANLGIVAATGRMSELHTHDTSGLLHIESDSRGHRYTLGQVFTEWGVRLQQGRIGSRADEQGRTLRAYIDGKPTTGNPAEIELLPHRQVALVYGTALDQQNPPPTYQFAPGD
ncbi:hypothetical protein [Amnibacterium endophyticum]|uniref:Uncharacterized protein n=1 Tax=Amnibacterium endophyticum TaxID=2109337 RepID=A0ABW4LIT1_9MICO